MKSTDLPAGSWPNALHARDDGGNLVIRELVEERLDVLAAP